jgi:molecular chaperone GrpE
MSGQVLEESEDAAEAGLGMENEVPAAVEETAEMVTLPAADLEKLKGDKDEYYDRLLRLGAEFENYKKRVQKEFDSFRKYAAEDVVLELLPVLDSFERALGNVPEGVNDGFREGVEIIYRQLAEALDKIGLVPMDVVGKKFDPNIHDALTGVQSEEHDEGTVVEEFLKGYTLFDKVVRHAKVSVSSGQGENEDNRNEP